MTQIALPLGATNSGSNDWSDVHNEDAAIVAVVNGDLRNDNIYSGAAIAYSKLATMSTGAVLLGNAGTPTATTLTGDVTVGATGVTAIGSGVIVNADINASAAIADTKLASSNNSTYRTVFWADSLFSNQAGTGTYGLGRPFARQSAISASTAESGAFVNTWIPLPLFHWVAADHAVGSLTTKLNIRSVCMVNATSPGTTTLTVGMYPLTVAGGDQALAYTLGTLVSGSGSAHANPSTSTANTATSSDFTIPSDGVYGLGCVISGNALADKSAVHISAQIRRRNV